MFWLQILRWWHDFGITLTLSIFATLAFEAPILGIEKAIFGRSDAKPVPKKPTHVDPSKAAPIIDQVTEPVPTTQVLDQVPENVALASPAVDPSKA